MIEGHCSLDLLESCELASKALSIPSWVPDWSSPSRSRVLTLPKWSASAWISAQATIAPGNLLSAAGVEAATVVDVFDPEMDEFA
jgi:hypothetical protein